MKTKNLIILIIILTLSVLSYCYLLPRNNNKDTIAIFTTIHHPALDDVRDGFIKEIKINYPEVKLVDYNAEGNVQQANIIASQIANNKNIMGVLSIGTLAAQSMAKKELIKPIVIAAVSDVKLIQSQGNNVCGMTDTIDANYQMDTIIDILPNIKSISLLYSPHEANSISMVENLKKAALQKNITINLVGAFDAQQISSASLLACKKSDAVLIPLDNQLVAAMPVVIKSTKSLSCPIITSNESPIHQGASMAFGVNYKKSGADAALIMSKIIDTSKTYQEIGFIEPDIINLYINKKVIDQKNITLNENTKSKIIMINSEEN